MKEAKSIFPKANQTALLYENGSIVLKRDYTADSVIYTRYDAFVGTKEEVEAKITELGLKEPEKKVKTPTSVQQTNQSTTPATSGGLFSKVASFFTGGSSQ